MPSSSKTDKRLRRLELLAPARDAQTGIDAIDHGADAVYIGATRFGARAAASNSVDDIAQLTDYAHQFGARVYVTVNTIVYDHELAEAEQLISDLYCAGADALIVQDLGLLRLDLPPIALHASTQCDLRTPEKARFLDALGFSQLVLARELSINEIAAIAAVTPLPLEVFVHGALCVCYSGRCQASQVLMGRSANRGECAQICRLRYDLEDADTSSRLISGKHLLSLRDLNLSDRLAQLIDAGATSFKIEGRLKDDAYVRNITAYYRHTLDRLIAQRPDELARASDGSSQLTFTPDPSRSFNRSFTHYFLDSRTNPKPMANHLTPKSMGEPLGKVLSQRGRTLRIATNKPLANGDGLSYVDSGGRFAGVRVNRVIGSGEVELREAAAIQRGCTVYRTADKAFADILSRPSARRTIGINATLRVLPPNRIALMLTDESGQYATSTATIDNLQPARTSQTARQTDELAKLGDTVFRLSAAEVAGDWFVPASALSALRREAIGLLSTARRASYIRPHRRSEQPDVPWNGGSLQSSDNVANTLSEKLYHDHNATIEQRAIECADIPAEAGTIVMVTRYCLRRELGACLKTANANALPRNLLLRSGNVALTVDCDCSQCEMRLRLATPDKP